MLILAEPNSKSTVHTYTDVHSHTGEHFRCMQVTGMHINVLRNEKLYAVHDNVHRGNGCFFFYPAIEYSQRIEYRVMTRLSDISTGRYYVNVLSVPLKLEIYSDTGKKGGILVTAFVFQRKVPTVLVTCTVSLFYSLVITLLCYPTIVYVDHVSNRTYRNVQRFTRRN